MAFNFFVVMAFLPILITILVLVLKAAQDEDIAHPSPVMFDDERGRNHVRRGPRAMGITLKTRTHNWSGPAPVSERGILVTAFFVIVPSLLVTWEQGIRTAQVCIGRLGNDILNVSRTR